MDAENGSELFGVRVKTWLVLTAAGVVASLLALPFAVTFVGQLEVLGIELVALNTVIVAALFGLTSFIGLKLSKKIELEPAPVLEGKAFIQGLYKEAVGFGLIVGIVTTFLLRTELVVSSPLWMGFLASFHGSIGEELLLRLFLLSVLAFVMVAIRKRFSENKGSYAESRIMWIAILGTAFLFGLWHLQAEAAIGKVTITYAIRVITMSSTGSVFFGWLFWKRGIESAMLCHFTANILLHVISPLLVFGFI